MESVNPAILRDIILTLAGLAVTWAAVDRAVLARKIANKPEKPDPAPHVQFADAKTCIQKHDDMERRIAALEAHNSAQDKLMREQYDALRALISDQMGKLHARADNSANKIAELTGCIDMLIKTFGGKS